jgi:DNA-binding response OmpR family regulator
MDRVKDIFFGRERVMREIVSGVLAAPQPASFSLVGSKFAGKSRVLDYLASEQGPLLNDDLADWRPYAYQDAGRVIAVKVDCDWQDAQDDLLGHVVERLTHQLREVERIELDWAKVNAQPGASRRIWQISRQLNQMSYRLVLLMDNFDTVFENALLNPDSVDELRPLTRELALVVATEQPLHDLDRELAASPLFNVMTQLFIGLLEPEAARQWLAAYGVHYPAIRAIEDELLELTGNHPFLLYRVEDILAEVQLMLGPGETLGVEHLPLVRLRLAEHGRLLFVTHWRTLQHPPRRIDPRQLMALVERLLTGHIAMDQLTREQIPILNWLINQAMVMYGAKGYCFFSPLFTEFVAHRLSTTPATGRSIAVNGGAAKTSASYAAKNAAVDVALYAQLTKIEGALLRYFQSHSDTVISPEQLLAEVWGRPDASPRRVQEAIRRLRLQLEQVAPPVGSIENERGQGYRFVPAGRDR